MSGFTYVSKEYLNQWAYNKFYHYWQVHMMQYPYRSNHNKELHYNMIQTTGRGGVAGVS